VQATGLNGEARKPNIRGEETFHGVIKHSTEFSTATSKYDGKKVIVVGSGNSGHDIATDAYGHGAHVTMVQRSPTYVMSLPAALKMLITRYNEANVTSPAPRVISAVLTAHRKPKTLI
jgi:cation diffusion facilitator CzcD-associated flavoprotein CzcO